MIFIYRLKEQQWVQMLPRNDFRRKNIFVKKTDRNRLLRDDSFHPPHTKKSLPQSQLLRVKRIEKVSEQQIMRVKEMKEKYKQRGFPERILEQAGSEKRKYETNKKKDQQVKRIPNVSRFNVLSGEISKTLRKEWGLLARNLPEKNSFSSPHNVTYKGRYYRRETRKSRFGSSGEINPDDFNTTKMGTFSCYGCSHCSNVLK
ncbi:hypothetical protein XELAEV_180022142mg, partial [Xenopus laevis]